MRRGRVYYNVVIKIMENFFAYQTAAERYSQSRPYFHPLVVGKIKEFLQLQEPVAQALDVGCGTGQSALALTSIAKHVTGTDVSTEMLAQATSDAHIQYLEAPAEALPLPNSSFDLITVSLAFHWFDRDRFLAEAHRLLRPSAWLIIYNNGFSGQMKEMADYEEWDKESYRARYPTPPRNNQSLGPDEAQKYGFQFVRQEPYSNDVMFTVEQLASYLTTQSNVIAAVEQGTESNESVYNWLINELAPMFKVSIATFSFGGSIGFFQKT